MGKTRGSRMRKSQRHSKKKKQMGGAPTCIAPTDNDPNVGIGSFINDIAFLKSFSYATLVAWYDAKDPNGNGNPAGDGSVVGTWVDKSGNGNNLNQWNGTETYYRQNLSTYVAGADKTRVLPLLNDYPYPTMDMSIINNNRGGVFSSGNSIPLSTNATVFIVGVFNNAIHPTWWNTCSHGTFFGHLPGNGGDKDWKVLNIRRYGGNNRISVCYSGPDTLQTTPFNVTNVNMPGAPNGQPSSDAGGYIKSIPFIMAFTVHGGNMYSYRWQKGTNNTVFSNQVSVAQVSVGNSSQLCGINAPLWVGGNGSQHGTEYCVSHISEVIYYNTPCSTNGGLCPQDTLAVAGFLAWKWGFQTGNNQGVLNSNGAYYSGPPISTPTVSAAKAAKAQASAATASAAQQAAAIVSSAKVAAARASAAAASAAQASAIIPSAARASAAQAAAFQNSAAMASAAQASAAVASAAIASNAQAQSAIESAAQVALGLALPAITHSPVPLMLGGAVSSLPAPTGISPILWLDASDTTTLLGSTGSTLSPQLASSTTKSRINTWKDKSGKGNNLTLKWIDASTGNSRTILNSNYTVLKAAETNQPMYVGNTVNGVVTPLGVQFSGMNVLANTALTGASSNAGYAIYIVMNVPVDDSVVKPIAPYLLPKVYLTVGTGVNPGDNLGEMFIGRNTLSSVYAYSGISANVNGVVLPSTTAATLPANQLMYPTTANTIVGKTVLSTIYTDTVGSTTNTCYNTFFPFTTAYPSTTNSEVRGTYTPFSIAAASVGGWLPAGMNNYVPMRNWVVSYSNPTVSEVIIYPQTLTLVQRQAIEGYLTWKWGIQDNLPDSHPWSAKAKILAASAAQGAVLSGATASMAQASAALVSAAQASAALVSAAAASAATASAMIPSAAQASAAQALAGQASAALASVQQASAGRASAAQAASGQVSAATASAGQASSAQASLAQASAGQASAALASAARQSSAQQAAAIASAATANALQNSAAYAAAQQASAATASAAQASAGQASSARASAQQASAGQFSAARASAQQAAAGQYSAALASAQQAAVGQASAALASGQQASSAQASAARASAAQASSARASTGQASAAIASSAQAAAAQASSALASAAQAYAQQNSAAFASAQQASASQLSAATASAGQASGALASAAQASGSLASAAAASAARASSGQASSALASAGQASAAIASSAQAAAAQASSSLASAAQAYAQQNSAAYASAQQASASQLSAATASAGQASGALASAAQASGSLASAAAASAARASSGQASSALASAGQASAAIASSAQASAAQMSSSIASAAQAYAQQNSAAFASAQQAAAGQASAALASSQQASSAQASAAQASGSLASAAAASAARASSGQASAAAASAGQASSALASSAEASAAQASSSLASAAQAYAQQNSAAFASAQQAAAGQYSAALASSQQASAAQASSAQASGSKASAAQASAAQASSALASSALAFDVEASAAKASAGQASAAQASSSLASSARASAAQASFSQASAALVSAAQASSAQASSSLASAAQASSSLESSAGASSAQASSATASSARASSAGASSATASSAQASAAQASSSVASAALASSSVASAAQASASIQSAAVAFAGQASAAMASAQQASSAQASSSLASSARASSAQASAAMASTARASSSQESAARASSARSSSAQASAATASMAAASSAQTSAAQASSAQASSAQVSAGRASAGQASAAQASAGQASAGQASAAIVSAAQALIASGDDSVNGKFVLPTTDLDQTILTNQFAGRYIRVMPSTNAGDGFIHLSQIIVYDVTGSVISTGVPVYYTSVIKSTQPGTILVDGTQAVRPFPNIWHSATNNRATEFVELDLGSVQSIDSVRILGRSDCPATYKTCNQRMLRLRVQINTDTTTAIQNFYVAQVSGAQASAAQASAAKASASLGADQLVMNAKMASAAKASAATASAALALTGQASAAKSSAAQASAAMASAVQASAMAEMSLEDSAALAAKTQASAAQASNAAALQVSTAKASAAQASAAVVLQASAATASAAMASAAQASAAVVSAAQARIEMGDDPKKGKFILPSLRTDQTLVTNHFMGRYIRVKPALNQGDGYLNLSQIFVYNVLGKNIAFKAPTYATSTMDGGGLTSILVDGSKGVRGIPNVWSQQTDSRDEFVEVDLGSVQAISAIRILGTSNCEIDNMCQKRMFQVRVEINKDTTDEASINYMQEMDAITTSAATASAAQASAAQGSAAIASAAQAAVLQDSAAKASALLASAASASAAQASAAMASAAIELARASDLENGNDPANGKYMLPTNDVMQVIKTNGIQGRFIRLKPSVKSGDGWINLSQVIVKSESEANVARNRPVFATSTIRGGADPSVVVDGTLRPRNFPGIWQSKSGNRSEEFFEIDLGSRKNISSIQVIGRDNCNSHQSCMDRMLGLRIEVNEDSTIDTGDDEDVGEDYIEDDVQDNVQDNVENDDEYTDESETNTDGQFNFSQSGGAVQKNQSFESQIIPTNGYVGQYVRIMPPKTNGDGYIHFSQIMIYNILGLNIAAGKKIYASSTMKGAASPSILLDGSTRARGLPNIWHSATANRNKEFVEVNLGSPQAISAIRLLGRTDCHANSVCRKRMTGLRVQINSETTVDVEKPQVSTPVMPQVLTPVMPQVSAPVMPIASAAQELRTITISGSTNSSNSIQVNKPSDFVPVLTPDPSLPDGYQRVWDRKGRKYAYEHENNIFPHPQPPSRRIDHSYIQRPTGIPTVTRQEEAQMLNLKAAQKGGGVKPFVTDIQIVTDPTLTSPWQKYFDTGIRKYYYFTDTDESWEHPFTPRRPIVGEIKYGDSGLPDGWDKYLDSAKNKYFYYYPGTGETTWDHPNPPPFPKGLDLIPNDHISDLYAQYRDPATQQIFYFNTLTTETFWVLPHGVAGVGGVPGASSNPIEIFACQRINVVTPGIVTKDPSVAITASAARESSPSESGSSGSSGASESGASGS